MKPRHHITINKRMLMVVGSIVLVIFFFVFALNAAFGGSQNKSDNSFSNQEESNQTSDAFEKEADHESVDTETQKGTENDGLIDPTKDTPSEEQVNHPDAKDPTDLTTGNQAITMDQTEPTTPAVDDPTEPPVQQPEMSAKKIWDGMRSSMGESVTANMDLSQQNLADLYGIDPSICDEFVLRKAGTVVTPEEYLIVKGSESNLSIVEQACQQRQAVLKEQWKGLGHDFESIIDSYQVIRSGNYLFFGISPRVSQMVGLFQGLMMSVN